MLLNSFDAQLFAIEYKNHISLRVKDDEKSLSKFAISKGYAKEYLELLSKRGDAVYNYQLRNDKTGEVRDIVANREELISLTENSILIVSFNYSAMRGIHESSQNPMPSAKFGLINAFSNTIQQQSLDPNTSYAIEIGTNDADITFLGKIKAAALALSMQEQGKSMDWEKHGLHPHSFIGLGND